VGCSGRGGGSDRMRVQYQGGRQGGVAGGRKWTKGKSGWQEGWVVYGVGGRG